MFIGCKKKEVFITVELPDQPDVSLYYSVPISGTNFLGFRDTLKANETGIFELKMKIIQPSFIVLWDEKFQNSVKLLVEPDNNYYVSMGLQKNVQITGANEKGQMLYTTLPNPDFIELELRKIGINTFNISDTISSIYVHQKINELKQSDMSKFRELLNGGEISKSFFDLVQRDRDCYYASMEAKFAILKANKQFSNKIKIEDDFLENLKKIYEQYPPNDEKFIISSFWLEYAELFVTDYKQDFDFQKLQNFRKNGTYHTYIINESKKYLSGKAIEFFQAKYIWGECFQGSFEKEFISLFEQFENDYPRSKYSKYISPYIDKIISYHQIIEKPFDSAMLFMDNYETINTLEEAVKPLQGRKIYIDVWATWCNPCLREFVHNDALKKILAENNIQQLYISVDRDDYDQNWKNYIKYYHLTGTHIRANKELYDNLLKQHNFIPRYILIDEKGNIMEEHAKSPSQLVSGEKLL